MNSDMKRAIIIGATSGIGREVAKQLLLQGWRLGIAGRRLPALEALQSSAPDLIEIAVLDVTQPDATPKLNNLIRRVGGMDLFLLSSGIGYQNMELNPDIELDTARTNVEGFMRMFSFCIPATTSVSMAAVSWQSSVPLPGQKDWE